MSKLGCACGYTISDTTDFLRYKASLLKDIHRYDFFDFITDEIQSYVLAVQAGRIREWQLEKGYGADYIALGLDHGNILHDHIHLAYLSFQKDMYECPKCGRILIEHEANQFHGYSADSGQNNHVLDDRSIPEK